MSKFVAPGVYTIERDTDIWNISVRSYMQPLSSALEKLIVRLFYKKNPARFRTVFKSYQNFIFGLDRWYSGVLYKLLGPTRFPRNGKRITALSTKVYSMPDGTVI